MSAISAAAAASGAANGVQQPEGRFHALDALRAFVLLLGVVFHTTIAYVVPPDGSWAVGTLDTSYPLWWFIVYSHSFRMSVFYLLAGFFASLVIGRKGMSAFLRDRVRRILLVFLVAVYPIKLVVTAIWIDGGVLSGWIQFPPELASMPLWDITVWAIKREAWPAIPTAHLWFLYYLLLITGAFLLPRALALRTGAGSERVLQSMDRGFRRAISSRLAPVGLALLILPMMSLMQRYSMDTPDKTVAVQFRILLVYTLYFGIGWWLHRQVDLLEVFARRWKVLLPLGLAMSVLNWGADYLQVFGEPGQAFRWAGLFVSGLTMSLNVLGWIGLFVAVLRQPSPAARYLADSSYWIYLAHIPIVTGLQVWFYEWDSVWLKLLVINAISFGLLFASYHAGVRFTWLGRWLTGPRQATPVLATAWQSRLTS